MTNQNNEIKYETLTKTEQVVTDLLRSIVSLNFHSLNQQIENQRLRKQLDPDNDYKRRSKLSKEDQQTPEKLIELLCKQYTEIKVTDLFLDVCCGRGSMLFYLHNTYGIPKENLYGIDIDRRNVEFLKSRGFNNIVLGDALDEDTWAELNAKLKSNTLYIIKDTNKEGETESMPKFNKVIMNPPYAGNLHLKVLEKTLKHCKPEEGCEVVNISPVRWLEDPLAKHKKNTDYKNFKESIVAKLSSLKMINAADATLLFKIDTGADLAIYTFKKAEKATLNIIQEVPKSCIDKILTKTLSMNSLNTLKEANKVNGYRCEIKEMLPEGGSHSLGESNYSKNCGTMVVLGPYKDGYNSDGIFFKDSRSKNGREKDYFRYSIKFNSEEEATNFSLSCNTNFYRNYLWIIKYDQHAPLGFLPYMEDYSHAWTDEDYCKFFELTPEESEFMCRTVDDYRVKDFINYEEI